MNIGKYKVCYGESPEILTGMVNRNIEEGWQPFGNAFTTIGSGIAKPKTLVCQPMVQYANEMKEKESLNS
jgi:hypothetical protein